MFNCFLIMNVAEENSLKVHKVWVFTVDNQDVKRYTNTEAICEFKLS